MCATKATTMVMRHKTPRLTLLGAGPGDPDLITRKGWKALQMADVVLYDALVHPDLIAEIPTCVRKIYVGKRSGSHCATQTEINQLIVEAAHQYGHVVRLKGGDPFVFGRGMEEIEFARAHGIQQIEVIPGISSAIAGPAAAGIPVTSRGLSNSFWVLTATTLDGAFAADMEKAAQSDATVVLLMGMRKIQAIAELFVQFRGAETPIAIIQNATLDNQRTTIAQLGNIASRLHEVDIHAPGIVVIGEVVRVGEHFASASVLNHNLSH